MVFKMTPEEKKQHNKFLNIAQLIASDSKCIQLHVGAVLVKDKRIISTGYNGTPSGFINCNIFFENKQYSRSQHHQFSQSYQIHAEINSIIYAAINGIAIKDCIIYVTHQPCKNCLKTLCAAGIKKIYYRYSYDKAGYDNLTQKMLDDLNIELIHIQD